MKKSLGSLSMALLIIFYVTSYVSGQDSTVINFQRNTYLFEGSKKKEIVLPISEQSNVLILDITSTISAGVLTIEIYDPKGEKQGNFSIGSQLSSLKTNPHVYLAIGEKKGTYYTTCEEATPKPNNNKNQIHKMGTINSSKKLEKNLGITEKGLEIMGIGKEPVQGQISRSIKNPMKGDWIIRIICENAKGLFIIDTNQKLISQNLPSKIANIVTGTITDSTNRPILGAMIIVKGTKIGTISDINGNFSLELPVNAKTLVFSFVGMKSQELEIGDQTRFTITLKRDYNFKGDIIKVGYGTRKQP